MNNNYDAELNRMKNLMGYGMNEDSHRVSKSEIEYQVGGADGRTYGIIREGQKFYIKVAPKKDTKLVAEDFDYIGGYMNKKENEYLTYPMASKQLELKLMSINEVHDLKKPVKVEGITSEKAEWQVNETKEMRHDIDRFNEIVNNVGHILKEDKDSGFTMKHTLPEAPASNPSQQKVDAPYTDTATAKLDKDLKDTQTNPEKAGSPYTEDGKTTNKDMESDKPKGNGADDGVYCEKPQYVDTGVAGEHPKGGKVTRADEGKKHRNIKITEEQVLAWNNSPEFMDKSKGTEIGSSAPYTDQVDGKESNQDESGTESIHEEANVVHNTDNQNSPTPGTNEKGDSAPYTEKPVNEDTVDPNDVDGLTNDNDDVPFPEVEDGGSYLDFEQDYNDWLDNQDNNDTSYLDGLNNDDDNYEMDLDPSLTDIGDDPYANENHNRKGCKMNEDTTVLNDFGKHPAYRKKPMTTPPNKEIDKFGRDWNDDSAKGEQPFGQKIGNSAPYTEEVNLDQLTDAVLRYLKRSNKKKSLSERKVIKVPSNPEPEETDFEKQNMTSGNDVPPMNEPNGEMMPPPEDNNNMGNQFDNNFDAGVDADEESNPKKYIQQLTGKLSQSLRSYNDNLGKPDADLNKYVAGMIIKQATEGLTPDDAKEILDKVKKDETEEEPSIDGNPTSENDEENMPQGDESQPQNGNMGESIKRHNDEKLEELVNQVIDNQDEEDGIQDRPIQNISYKKKPFTSPNFK